MQPTDKTSRNPGILQPAEWEPHRACWLAWPSHADLWQENLEPAQREFVDLCRAIADRDPVSGEPRGERLEVLVPNTASHHTAEQALGGLAVRFHEIPFGDIWLRDTAPVFLVDPEGAEACATFRFNGWGGKYVLPHDSQVAERIAVSTGVQRFAFPWVLEGGSVDVDGEGTCLTTRQCLLHPNRNPSMELPQVEEGLRQALGVRKVLWLGEGLQNDHTDGHVDTLARFVAPGVVVCMEPLSQDDPNRDTLDTLAQDLSRFVDARGRTLQVVRIPSPGKVLSSEGELLPASYMNFYIGNTTVVVPTYGSPWDAEAVTRLGALFPGRRTVGVSARAILSGGGAFHCITQQQPAGGIR